MVMCLLCYMGGGTPILQMCGMIRFCVSFSHNGWAGFPYNLPFGMVAMVVYVFYREGLLCRD